MKAQTGHADRTRTWLSRQTERTVEIIPGFHAPNIAYGRLSDPDILPGQPLTAGGYGEDRADYASPLFAPGGEEPRTVHLGIDVFAPAGAEVFAPLAGVIHSFADNARPEDYGPTIILTHEPEPGVVFHSLYGHLSRESLDGLTEGMPVAKGQRIAALGDRSVNGGWPPHLHFQITLDMLGMKGDFPGVCRRSERDRWLALCPDPAPLLGLQHLT